TTIDSILAINPTTGTWSKNGTGKLILSGASANTGAGAASTVNVNDGTLELNKSGAVVAIPALIVNVGDGIGAAGSASLKLTGASTSEISDSAVMAIRSDGSFDLNGKTETIADLTSM